MQVDGFPQTVFGVLRDKESLQKAGRRVHRVCVTDAKNRLALPHAVIIAIVAGIGSTQTQCRQAGGQALQKAGSVGWGVETTWGVLWFGGVHTTQHTRHLPPG